ncbi:uncharacterized protein EI97DRAFT_460357 [Westerdykella ornata]|uniref:Mitochondrial cytochrome c oxidase assembly factor n=1 Tax=Westerdykella ornata TaxID=318751 RepID=A0A6A6JCS5_WESOR|nr:uncharacterized protein EI97DRAFT_460357 [Westerdykella ornata]KAF2274232.1 hypothetical protein EI97DRAFT_460357 [Westerdykella ornata]
MGGPNLEIFKFGMYILFPISIMYYFGTNLDGRFSVPDFWPKEGQTHKIPYEREEIKKELERLKARNLEAKRRREAEEARAALVQQQVQGREGEQ